MHARAAWAWVLVTALAGPCAAAVSGKANDGVRYVLVAADGGPVAGADLSIVGRSGSVRTAEDGAFRLDPEPSRPFDLIAFDPAGEILGSTTVGPGDGPVLVLVPSPVETVRVVSGVAPSTRAPPAAAATVLSREETDRVQPNRLVETLREVPGAEGVGSGQTAVPAVRGLARGRTLILLDGARVTAERRAGASGTYLNPFALQNVEVVRGPGSVAYGSDAIGGVIHARTPRPRPGERGGRYEIAGGVGVPYGAIAVEARLPTGRRSAVLAQVHGRDYGDYRSPDGREPYSSARGAGGLFRGVVDRGRARFDWGIQVDRGRDIERPAVDTFRRVNRYPEEDSDRFTFGFDLAGDERWTGLDVEVFVGRYRLVTERETFATATDPNRLSRAEVDADDASVRVVAGRRLGRGTVHFGVDVHGRFGLRARDVQVDRPEGAPAQVVGDQRTIESASALDAGAFAEVERPVGSSGWSVAAGARVDHVRTDNEGGFFGDRSTSESSPSGYVAIRVPLARAWELSLQAARGFRDPTLSDRYFRGTTGRGTITGNPDLDPETSRQFDLAVRGTRGPVRVGAFAYLYRIRDLIERYEFAPDEFAFRNRAEQESYGAELEIDVRVSPDVDVRAALQWARGEILDDGAPAADVPAPAAVVSVDHRPSERWWWRASARVQARDDRPGEQEIVTPGYATFALAAGRWIRQDVEIRAVVDNVFDRRVPGSSDDTAPAAPGIAASLVVAGRF